MDAQRFDRLTRRFVLEACAAALGWGSAHLPGTVIAKRRKRVRFNTFGCVNVGRFCRKARQCCSGICQGKKGKKTCRALSGGVGCQAGQRDEVCGGTDTACTTAAGFPGLCNTTTGKAGYCGIGGGCFPCTHDPQCVDVFGAGAACVVCAVCADGTACRNPL